MIVTLLLWLTLGWFLGVFLYLTAGFVTLPVNKPGWTHSAATYYTKVAQKLIGRSALMERGTKWDIVSTTHDAGKNADTFDLDGDEAHATNDTGLLSHFHKQPFGLLPPPEDGVASFVSPEIVEFGEIEVQRREQNTLRTKGGAGVYDEEVTLPDHRPLVRLREYADAMIPGSMGLHDVSEIEEIYIQSQAGFTDSSTVRLMLLIVAYGGGALMTWLILTNAGGTVPTGVDVPSLALFPGWLL